MADLLPLDLAPALASRFVQVLECWLTPRQMREVRRINAVELAFDYERFACASHDFCDANMAMVEAFNMLDLPTPGDEGAIDGTPGGDRTCSLWNTAWRIAFLDALQPKEGRAHG